MHFIVKFFQACYSFHGRDTLRNGGIFTGVLLSMRSVTHVCYRMDLILDLVSAIDVLQCDAQPPADFWSLIIEN